MDAQPMWEHGLAMTRERAMDELTQDHRFIAFVAGFASSNEGYNCECMFDHLAQDRFGEEFDSKGETFAEYVAYCARQPEFVKLYREFAGMAD